MDKFLLIKFFQGQASEQEANMIIEWISKSKANKDFFAKEKELWTMSNFVDNFPDKYNLDNIYEKIRANSSSANNRFKRWYFGVAAAVAVLLIVNLTLLLFNRDNTIQVVNDTNGLMSDNVINTVNHISDSLVKNRNYSLYTNRGIKAAITLPDGSKVWLNSDTKIEYPKEFLGKSRDITIDGEAYLEVVKNPKCPMIISTNKNFTIEVYGTTLSVKSYANEATASASLYSGQIKLLYGSKNNRHKNSFIIKPNETCLLKGDNSNVELIKVVSQNNIKNNIAWKEGELLFDNTQMEEVIKMLERWHGTKFVVKNENIYKYTLSASFDSESIVQIMEIIKLCIPINYAINNNNVVIY